MMEDEKKVSIKDLSVTQSNSLVEATYPRTYVKRDGTEGDIDLKVSTRAHKVSRLIVSLISPDDADLRFYRIDDFTRFVVHLIGRNEVSRDNSFGFRADFYGLLVQPIGNVFQILVEFSVWKIYFIP